MPTSTQPERLIKSFTAVETKVLDEAKGIVECVFSVTQNVDRGDDVIESGAFTKAAETAASKGRLPTVVFGHQWDDIHQVLGKTLSWKELEPGSAELPDKLSKKGFGGMKAVIQFELGVPAGQVALTLLKGGSLCEWSFAFDIAEGGSVWDAKAGIRRIKSIEEIFEISLVLIGMNQDTANMALKGLRRRRPSATWSDASKGRLAMARELAKQFVADHAETRKAAFGGDAEAKAMWLPVLEGDEAQHNGPLNDALDAIDTLIAQELAEGKREYDCVVSLCYIAMELIWWAQNESYEMGSGDYGVIPYGGDEYYAAAATETKTDGEASDCETCDGSGTIREGNVECPDCEGTGKQKAQPAPIPEAMPIWMLAAIAAALSPATPPAVSADTEPKGGFDGLMKRLDPARAA